MNNFTNGTIKMSDGSLYYEVRGSGPKLIMIHGGGGDADKFVNVANDLSSKYTIITYDRRGHSRSKLVENEMGYSVEKHSDDLYRLLSELSIGPVSIFGSSSGAVIGLDFCSRYPELVRLFIPHEPVLLQFLTGQELTDAQLFLIGLQDKHRNDIRELSSSVAMNEDQSGEFEQKRRTMNNLKYFVDYEIPGVSQYGLDIEMLKKSLKSSSMRILPAGGSESRDFFPYRCAVLLAEQIGAQIVEFPGHHTGYNSMIHKEFADRLSEVLDSGS